MDSDRKGKYTATMPVNPKLVAAIVVTAVIVFTVTAAKMMLTPMIKESIESELKTVFGRDVSISSSGFLFPLKIKRMIVSSGSVEDMTPVADLAGIRVTPNLRGLLRMKLLIDKITIDTVSVRIQKRADGSWNTAGLFSAPPAEEALVGEISSGYLDLSIDAGSTPIRGTYGFMLKLGNKGAFTLNYAGLMANGMAMYGGLTDPRYTAEINLDSFAFMESMAGTKLRAVYSPTPGIVDLNLSTTFATTPGSIYGRVMIESDAIRCDSSVWAFGERSGRLAMRVDDLEKSLFHLETIGAIEFDAASLDRRATAGRLVLKKARLGGAYDGTWNVEADLKISGLDYAEPKIRGLDFEGVISGASDKTFKLHPDRSQGKLAFRSAEIEAYSLANAMLDLRWLKRELTVKGKVNLDDAGIRTPGLVVGLDADYKPNAASGRIELSRMDVRRFGVEMNRLKLFGLSGEFDVELEKRSGAWKLLSVDGAIADADISFMDDPVRIVTGKIDIAADRNMNYTGYFDGVMNVYGGGGRALINLKENAFESATIALSELRVAKAGKLLPEDKARLLAEYATLLDIDGVVENRVVGGKAEWRFDGTVQAPDFHIADSSGRKLALAAGITTRAAYDEAKGEARFETLKVILGGGRSSVTLPTFAFGGGSYSGSAEIDKIDFEDVERIVEWLKPDLPVSKMKMRGAFSNGTIKKFSFTDNEWSIDGLTVHGDFMLKDKPLRLTLDDCSPSSDGPSFLVYVHTFSPDALYAAMCDLDPKTPRGLVDFSGTAGCTVQVIGNSWKLKPTINGFLNLNNTTVALPAQKIRMENIEGFIPIRLQVGEQMSPEAWASSSLTIRKLYFRDVLISDVKGSCRFDVNTLHFDQINYGFAGGTGKAVFAMNLPAGSRSPKIVVIGNFRNVNARTVYDNMQPFEGKLEGSTNGSFKIQLADGRFEVFDLGFVIDKGVIGSQLLRAITGQLEVSSIEKQVLDNLELWNFKQASCTVALAPRLLDLAKFEEIIASPDELSDRNEFFITFNIKGPARSNKNEIIREEGDTGPRQDHFFIANLLPTNIFLSMLELRIHFEKMPLRRFTNFLGVQRREGRI